MSKKSANRILIVLLHVCGWALLFTSPFPFLANAPIAMSGGGQMSASGDFIIDSGMPPTPGAGVRIENFDLPDSLLMEGAIIGHINAPVPIDPKWIQIESIATNLLLAIFFYTNMFVLVPKVLSKKGWLFYGALVLMSFFVYVLTGHFIRQNFLPFEMPFGPPLFINSPNFFMVFGLSLALRLMEDRRDYETVLKEQENEKLKSELSFLRSQVSPHFMFNVLNSLASLARKKSDHLEPAIIQLSQLMRYTLYHSDKKVSLEQEAMYLTNYIEIQKLRFGHHVNLHLRVNLEQKEAMIEPMLLVPFVENAFKHGVGLIQDPVMMIILESSFGRMNFSVRNKFNPSGEDSKDPSSGIGLSNVRRRLDLLYKDKYELYTYVAEEIWFVAELKLILE
jgi:two-component system, LytTR family, sensor kinase